MCSYTTLCKYSERRLFFRNHRHPPYHPWPYPFPRYLTVLKDNNHPGSAYSKPHYRFPESHSKQTTQPTDARLGACIPILMLIPVHGPKASGALSDALGDAAWRLFTSLNQLAHIIRSFEETPGNTDIPLDTIPILTNVAVSMSKRGSGLVAATVMGWTDV